MASVKKRIRSHLRHSRQRQPNDDDIAPDQIVASAPDEKRFSYARKEARAVATTTVPVDNRLLHMTGGVALNDDQTTPRNPNLSELDNSRHLASNQSASLSSLLALPDDILTYLAIHHLPFNTLIALQRTCHRLYTLVTTSVISRVRKRVIDNLLEGETAELAKFRETHPHYRFSHYWTGFFIALDYSLRRHGERPASELTCYGCLETLPIWRFVERMSANGTGLGGKLAHQRRCKDCMRRLRFVGGRWWKENWVTRRDVIRSRDRREKLLDLFESSRGFRDVRKSEQEGVCNSCGTSEEELWWGCSECYEVEMRARSDDRIVYWNLGIFNGKNGEAKKRKRCVAAMESVLSNWEVWRRSQKEANRRIREDLLRRRDNRRRWLPETEREMRTRDGDLVSWVLNCGAMVADFSSDCPRRWRPFDEVPVSTNRWESRCSTCWVPTWQKRWSDPSVVYDFVWPTLWLCKYCQQDHTEHEIRRQKRKGQDEVDEDQILAGLQRLFN